MDLLDSKYERLKKVLGQLGKVAVAFSGGVDSRFLLYTAARVLGQHCIAFTVDTPLIRGDLIEEARRFTEKEGIQHEILQWDALSLNDIVRNERERCYYCKKEMMLQIIVQARRLGFTCVIEGSNKEDENDFRPGIRAIKELGILSPLTECDFQKQDIREVSRRRGISGWDRPAESCLATRFPFGRPLTREGLKQVEGAESLLRRLGFTEVRVRHHGEVARIELPAREMTRFLAIAQKAEVYERFREMGFLYTALDLRGYRRGNMNTLVLDKG